MAETNTNQNFIVVWLDANINPANNDYKDAISKLREVSNTVNTFTNVDGCISHIIDYNHKHVYMILSGVLGETTVPIVHDMVQINAIYIFCGDKTHHEQWAKGWPKIQGVFTDIKLICEELKKTVQGGDQNKFSTSVVIPGGNTTDQNLDQLDSSFMYTQILKEILLTINFESEQFKEFINYCRQQLDGSTADLTNINKLEHEYHQHTPVWWYTYDGFLYSMVNSALRTMDMDLIIKLGFFIRDLHEHITRLHSEQHAEHRHPQSFVVYYAQSLSQTEFEELVKTEGGLFAFNHFLLTNKNRQGSLTLARETMENSDNVGILYVLTIDPSIQLTPFADVDNVSYHQNEAEVLFSTHSVFRIGEIKKIDGNNRLWQVNLTLTKDNDVDLNTLTEHLREETFTHNNPWHRLGNLLMKTGCFDEAQRCYQIKSGAPADDREEANTYLQLGSVKENQGEYEEAISFYTQAIEINQKNLPAGHPDLATCYSKIGSVYENIGEYSQALSSYEKALEIEQKALPPGHPTLATSYSNIGSVYEQMGDYPKALSSHEKAFKIYQNSLPPNHPDFATSYTNIGSVYEKMGEYSKALSSHEKALEIHQNSLPPGHPALATSYSNVGSAYEKMGEYLKALSSYEKALEIEQKALPPGHPDLATSYSNIGSVYEKMGEYSKALSFYERALDIGQHSLPADHPQLQLYKDNVETIKKKL